MAPLAQGFKFTEATQDEMGEVWQVLLLAYAKDENWGITFQDVKPEEIHPWVMLYFSPRWEFPDITTYTIKEEATGYVL
jgi:hypothetical protein